jgi:transcription elongation GreA/GreB family factor
MSFKEKVYLHCVSLINEKISTIQSSLDDIRTSIGNETKSTAGDKYETARAMLDIERENILGQMRVLREQKAALELLNNESSHGKAAAGSLVKTDKGYFYLSVALSRLIIDNVLVFALSAESPLGRKLLGVSIGDMVDFNSSSYIIEGVE